MTNTHETHLETPVLIVGAGPAGLVTAVELARHGIRSLLIEKHTGTSIYPRANSISTRTMEIFHSWGIEDDVRAVAIDAEPVISLRPSLMAAEGTEVQAGFPLRNEALQVSPSWPADCPQDMLEPILADYARSLGADLHFSCEMTALEATSEGVVCTARDRTSGEELVIHARYLIGCDGTRSLVRASAGIGFEGEPNLGRWSTVLFRADLTHRIPGRLALLYGIQGLPTETLFVLTSNDDRWIFAVRLMDDDEHGLEHLDDGALLTMIRQAAGVPDLEVEVLSRQTFFLGAEVATHFRKSSVFLAGDAAHRMTPQGGMGLNTAMHDAHNLAWKLAYMLNGSAGEGLLDTYEAERRPAGIRNTRRSAGDEDERRPDGLDIDLGYRYRSSAVWLAEDAEPMSDLPAGEPGARLPHFWCDTNGLWASSLDLVGPCFTLLASRAAPVWAEVVATGARYAGLPLAVGEVESGVTPDGRDWRRACGIGEDGAVLVRPDGFVAWRSRTSAGANEQLAGVLGQILSAPVAVGVV